MPPVLSPVQRGLSPFPVKRGMMHAPRFNGESDAMTKWQHEVEARLEALEKRATPPRPKRPAKTKATTRKR